MTANEVVSRVVDRERARRGLTRSALARELGVAPDWVTRKLDGERQWSMHDLDLLAERLDVPVAALLMAPAGGAFTREYSTLASRASRLSRSDLVLAA